jgi:hypothetical protein
MVRVQLAEKKFGSSGEAGCLEGALIEVNLYLLCREILATGFRVASSWSTAPKQDLRGMTSAVYDIMTRYDHVNGVHQVP